MATLQENATAVKTAQEAIDAAIVAKGGTTAGGLNNASAAIAAIPSGDRYAFDKPADWPDIRTILDNDNPSDYGITCTNKAIFLLNTQFRQTIKMPSTTGIAWRMSDGTVYTTAGGTHTFEGSIGWVISYANSVINLGFNDNWNNAIMWCYGLPTSDVTASGDDARQPFLKAWQCPGLLSKPYRIEWLGGGQDYVNTTNTSNGQLNSSYLTYVGCRISPYHIKDATLPALERIEYPVDFSMLTGSVKVFNGFAALKYMQNDIDLRGITTNNGSFLNMYGLRAYPTNLKINVSFSFAQSGSIIYRDSFAKFDSGLNVIGGMVYGLNECSNSGQTVTVNANTKSCFTQEQWSAIADYLGTKNWGLSPA